MKKALIILFLSICLIGCKPGGDTNGNGPSDPVNKAPATSTAPAPGHGGGVAPMASGAAGGMTPMSGTDSVEGSGGGGVGQAAKKMAKDKTANTGSGSLDQAVKDDSGQ